MLDQIGKWTGGDEPDPLKGAVAGAVGGFVGTLRMGRVSDLWNKINEKLELSESPRLRPLAKRQGTEEDPLPPFGDRTQTQAQQQVADAISTATGHPLKPHDREIGGEIVHKATGVLLGAAYGLAAEYVPTLRKTHGIALGVVAYLVGRQGALPLLGLAPPPKKQPAADHLLSLLSYLAYGFFCETVRGRLRQTMKAD